MRINIFLLMLFMSFYSLKAIEKKAIYPGKVIEYQIDGENVIFSLDSEFKIRLSFLHSDVFKVWIDPSGKFNRTNESFAVLNDAFDGLPEINIQETPQGFEIYTGRLILRVNAEPFRLSVFDRYQRLLLDDYKDDGFVIKDESKFVYKTLKNNENFFGLGEKGGVLNRRGQTFRMWNSDKPCYAPNEDPLYKSIPFFMSSFGYGIFLDNTYKTEFDFGSESNQYFSFQAPDGEMIYYFMYGPEYRQIIAHYTKLTGNPIMPPKWAFGFSQSRGLLTNEELTHQIADGFRSRSIPCDIIFQDIGWSQFLMDFEWRDNNYNDPRAMLSDLDEQGFKVVVSQNPIISQANTSQWEEADSLGFFTIDSRTGEAYNMPWPWGGNCGVVDFTKPDVADWWGKYQQKPIDKGIRGFWTDMGEPAWSNEEDTDRLYMQHYLGMHDEIHNVFGLLWDKVVTEQFEKHNPNQRVFQMTRAGFSGMQRYTFGWSGDAGHGGDVLGGWHSFEGQIPLALSAGMGLIPFWSTDISGYCGEIDDYDAFAELYVRWMQFGVFNPLSRAHHEGNNAVEPWLFGPEIERISRQAIETKYRLFPYMYTYAREAFDTGMPLMRALILEYPNDIVAVDVNYQFLLGSELLVAPVVEEFASIKRVYLPAGEWIDFNDKNTVYSGRQWIDYPVDLSTIPIFIKKGSIIPMMPVMQYIHEDPDYPIILNVFPAGINRKASFDLYEDDGETNDYKNDIYGTRNVVCLTTSDGYELSIAHHLHNGYDLNQRAYEIHIYMNTPPKRIISDLVRLPKKRNTISGNTWYWDEKSKKCVIKIDSTRKDLDLKIQLQ